MFAGWLFAYVCVAWRCLPSMLDWLIWCLFAMIVVWLVADCFCYYVGGVGWGGYVGCWICG